MNDSGQQALNPRILLWTLGGLTMLGPMSIDMYLPALPAMSRSLESDPSSLQLTITAFLLGFALGPLVLGPLSDAVGRRRVLIGCVATFILATLLCATVASVEELIIYRIVQALSGGSATTLARTIVHDIHQGDQAARMLSALMMILSLSLMVAPAIGSLLLYLLGWRAIFLTLAGLGLISLVSLMIFLPETLPPRARQPLDLVSALRGYTRILGSPRPLGFILSGAFAGGAMFAYLAATPFIFIDSFGLDPTLYGVLFAINMVGAIAINGLNMRLVMRFGYERMLAAASIGLLITGGGLMMITLTGLDGSAGVAIAVFAIVGLSHVMGTNGLTGALDQVRGRAGATSASFASCRFATGAITTWLVGVMNDGTTWPLAAAVMICAICAAVSTSVALFYRSRRDSSLG